MDEYSLRLRLVTTLRIISANHLPIVEGVWLTNHLFEFFFGEDLNS